MNSFTRFYDILNGEVEILKEKNLSVVISIYIPFSKYEEIADVTELQVEYAKRDLEGAIEMASERIIKKMNLDFIPYSTILKAKFKRISNSKVFFNVTVTGGNEEFLTDLKKIKNRI